MTDIVNGYRVVASEPSPRGGQVILADQGPGRQLRWVTGWLERDGTVLSYRNFFHHEHTARLDFTERCKRGC